MSLKVIALLLILQGVLLVIAKPYFTPGDIFHDGARKFWMTGAKTGLEMIDAMGSKSKEEFEVVHPMIPEKPAEKSEEVLKREKAVIKEEIVEETLLKKKGKE